MNLLMSDPRDDPGLSIISRAPARTDSTSSQPHRPPQRTLDLVLRLHRHGWG